VIDIDDMLRYGCCCRVHVRKVDGRKKNQNTLMPDDLPCESFIYSSAVKI
jgi:hypothetical protein